MQRTGTGILSGGKGNLELPVDKEAGILMYNSGNRSRNSYRDKGSSNMSYNVPSSD